MNVTNNLKLPQYTGEDIFDLQDINKAYDSIDKAYGNLDDTYRKVANIKNEITKTNATAEVIDARGNKETLGERLDEFGSQLDTKTSKEETKNVQAKLANDIETINSQMDSIVTIIDNNKSINEIENILNNNKKVLWKNGEYLIDKQINVNNNVTINFEVGVTLKATADIYTMFMFNEIGEITLKGNETVLDLNNYSDSGIIIQSTEGNKKSNITVDGFIIKNKALTSRKYISAITFRQLENVNVKNIKVYDYGYDNIVGNEVYGIGVHYCDNLTIKNIIINNVYIGNCYQETTNLLLQGFTLLNVKDNGIYSLKNCKVLKLVNGYINNVEEGIGSHADDIIIENVSFYNASNKAITIREGNGIKINNCYFNKNNSDIGDDGNSSRIVKNVDINNNTFVEFTEHSLFFRVYSNSKIINNTFVKNSATMDIIRIADLTENNGNFITVSNNIFNITNNTQSIITINPYNGGCNFCLVNNNLIDTSTIGIKCYLPSGGSGGTNIYCSKNMFKNVTTKFSFTGSLNVKNEDWL